MPRSTLLRFALVAALLLLAVPAALGKTSHAGWPHIDGKTVINHSNANSTITGLKHKHNELLGGHGNDTINAGQIGDVLWGDFNPGGQPTSQVDHINGGAGKDFIYASHGESFIHTGGGDDQIHAHFGHGAIYCSSGHPTVFLSHHGRAGWQLHGCKTISYASVGH